jgi:hypothetical protein
MRTVGSDDRGTEGRRLGRDASVDGKGRATTRMRAVGDMPTRLGEARLGCREGSGLARAEKSESLVWAKTHVMDVVANARAEVGQAAHDRGDAAGATRARGLASVSSAHGVGKGTKGETRDGPEVRARVYKCGTSGTVVSRGKSSEIFLFKAFAESFRG